MVDSCISWLEETMEVKDVRQKEKQLCGLMEFLQDVQDKDLKELELFNKLSGMTAYECVGRA